MTARADVPEQGNEKPDNEGRAMNSALLRYRLLLWLAAPLIFLINLWQALRAGDRRLFCQRQGWCLPRHDDRPLWLHAASVGELIAAEPLLQALQQRYPKLPLLVTTTTATGAALARNRLKLEHVYLPVDWPAATQRFLHKVRPRAALIMETELWPHLYRASQAADVPLLIINARLSPRSLNAGGWIKALLGDCLQHTTAILARSEQDAQGYLQLEATADKVQTVGNIKFATAGQGDKAASLTLDRRYVLAASTHDNEEQQLAQLWLDKKLGERFERLLVIAPRHPHRLNNILKQLQPLGARIAVRSRNDAVTDKTEIYLADTLGELEAFMAGAELVFMGGSLIARGGHNLLEPARLGKPVVLGPHMENFREETALLLDADAAVQVNDTPALIDCLAQWLSEPDVAKAHGERAQALMQQQGDVLERYLGLIEGYCAAGE